MRWFLLSALAMVCATSRVAAESNAQPTAVVNVSARVVSRCAIDARSPGAENVTLDQRCSDALPVRVEVGPVQTATSDGHTVNVVVTTINF